MKISNIKYALTSRVGRQLLKTSKASPKLLFAAGMVGFGATVVLAAKATLELDNVLDDHDRSMQTDDMTRRQQAAVYAGTVGQLCKLYAPAITVGTMSVACLTGSHHILNKRNVGLTAAYATVSEALEQYRAKVVEEYGAEKDEQFMHGGDKLVETKIDAEGKKKKVTRFAGNGVSMYARFFDDVNSKFWKPAADYNKLYILAQQAHANDRLRLQGHLFLNDVHDMLGMERTPEGQIVGWLDVDSDGDEGVVDFGLNRPSQAVEDFMRGHEASVLLDFNVQGNIWDRI